MILVLYHFVNDISTVTNFYKRKFLPPLNKNIYYHNYLCITHTSKFGLWNSEEGWGDIFSIIWTNFLEFVGVKFNICSTFYLVHMN